MSDNDLKNIQARQDRKARHNERANQELEEFFDLYKNKVEVISLNPLDMKKEYPEFLVFFRLTKPLNPKQFLKLIIEKIGDEI